MSDLQSLDKALTLIGSMIRCGDGDGICVAVPSKTYLRIKHAAMVRMMELSVTSGHPGVTISQPPPPGKNYENGFWFSGCWIEANL